MRIGHHHACVDGTLRNFDACCIDFCRLLNYGLVAALAAPSSQMACLLLVGQLTTPLLHHPLLLLLLLPPHEMWIS